MAYCRSLTWPHVYVQHSHMALIKIADLKNNLSRHLAHVKQGGQITVLDRDTPVARIIPFNPAGPADEATDPAGGDRMADLARQGILTLGDSPAAGRWLATHKPLRLPKGARGAVEALIDLRRESTR
jgi:antitoxin (DNA-binding transcriptional repressor) of toxin-antitoxin stability system